MDQSTIYKYNKHSKENELLYSNTSISSDDNNSYDINYNNHSSIKIEYKFKSSNIHHIESNNISNIEHKTEDPKDDVKIPRIIMQTWKDHNIPKKWRESSQSIQEHMKDWKYVLMTDEDNRNFVKDHFPEFLSYYDGFEYNIQRVDAIRYMWLYIHGGIYMDLDFVVLKPLDDLFKDITNAEIYLVSSGNIGVYITNSFMAAKPKCKLWLDVIERMKKPLPWFYLGKHMRVMNTTGPIMLTHVVTNSSYPYIRLPKAKINPCSVCDLRCPLGDTYLRPLEGSSWVGYDTAVYNYFMCNWKPVSIFVVILVVFILLWIIIKFICQNMF